MPRTGPSEWCLSWTLRATPRAGVSGILRFVLAATSATSATKPRSVSSTMAAPSRRIPAALPSGRSHAVPGRRGWSKCRRIISRSTISTRGSAATATLTISTLRTTRRGRCSEACSASSHPYSRTATCTSGLMRSATTATTDRTSTLGWRRSGSDRATTR